MTEQRHPIKPPRELVYSFLNGNPFTPSGMTYEEFIATHFAQEGADQELEACVEWVRSHFHGVPQWADQLRAARRPKAPSLAEQAQRILVENGGINTTVDGCIELDPDDIITIRAALERLKELEAVSND